MKTLLMSSMLLLAFTAPAFAEHGGDGCSSDDSSASCTLGDHAFTGGNATTVGLIALVGFVATRRRVA